ncbi:hypothetical protein Tco_1428837 [Tanacetum coccineum]
MGSMPVEFTMRLTVWTPNESVYANGVLYCMTSARAYNIMGYEMDKDKWKELGVPMGDTLEFATLVLCDGKRMPLELAKRFAGSSTKCAGIEGECVYTRILLQQWWCGEESKITRINGNSVLLTVVILKVGSSTLPNDWKGIIDALFKGEIVCSSEESCKGIGNLLWIVSADDDFGVAHLELKNLLGPDVKAFLSHVKPALLSAVEAL